MPRMPSYQYSDDEDDSENYDAIASSNDEVSDDEGLVLSRRLAHGKTCVGVDIRASKLSSRTPHKGFHELRSLDNVEDEHSRLFCSCVLSGQTGRLVPRSIVQPIVGVLHQNGVGAF